MAISFFKGVDIHRGNYSIDITPADRNKSKCIVEILGKYTQPVFVNYTGNCEEIAVVFKPVGANHFFNNDLIEVCPLFSRELNNILWTEFAYVQFNGSSGWLIFNENFVNIPLGSAFNGMVVKN